MRLNAGSPGGWTVRNHTRGRKDAARRKRQEAKRIEQAMRRVDARSREERKDNGSTAD
ncbi:hypothetical protein KIW74_gp17 [Mycobacterium phage Kimona]|uniref:Uncharacterized protein n=1 Tax=Mycobacterium phage Kimona TaxID=2024295 RepID=A0A249XU58_9CAUD|nr:hypothetical protein KIW74_gp17 [Mycobacterium phage Kimona]ASZ75511.1 hypothetical protein PBI_KIMONA_75 [Mycobacterium phage Kimona]